MTNELFACDGRVDDEKMYELLGVGTETDTLDYKSTLDLSRGAEKQKIEFAKDCMAMMNLPTGGYLVIGVDGTGAPALDVAPIDRSHFDSAALMQRVMSYVDCPVEVISAVHTHNTLAREIAVVYVRPSRSGFPAIASRDGSYRTDNRTLTVFREGEIFIREGTVNARLTHRMWPLALERYREAIKAEARRDIDHLVSRLAQNSREEGPGSPGIAPTLEMDDQAFENSVQAAFESGRPMGLRRFVTEAKNALKKTYKDKTGDRRQIALDRLTEFIAIAIFHEQDEQVEAGLKVMYSAYTAPLDESGVASTSVYAHQVETATYWLDILVRVYALGSLAVRCERWNAARSLTLQTIGDETYSYRSWIRHGMVEAARAGILSPKAGEEARGGVVISLALELSTKLAALHPDVLLNETPDQDAGRSATDPILDSICQFDILYCLIAATAPEGRGSEFYPSSAAFHQSRVNPILERVARNDEIRRFLFPGISDQAVAEAISGVVDAAASESWRYGGFWHGVQGSIERFVDSNRQEG